MSRTDPGWIVLTRELAADLLELVDAEVAAGREELSASWRGAAAIVAFFAAAVALLFWVVALLAYALVALASRWLPGWGAGLAVAGLFVAVAALLGALGWRRAARLENPIDVVVRRLRDHLRWWRTEVTLHPSLAAPGAEPRQGAEAGDGEEEGG
jgi:Putative Actinobacterial Holin-X, holin superfamily III